MRQLGFSDTVPPVPSSELSPLTPVSFLRSVSGEVSRPSAERSASAHSRRVSVTKLEGSAGPHTRAALSSLPDRVCEQAYISSVRLRYLRISPFRKPT